ncbi:conserved protein of unknown function [Pseudomonas marincola]|uniref:Uncharacterized protein n=1 Tax=Pseudomonas marincola TaxID=437900 RepID=A0A653E4Q3_9PSED|nr:conserved protein of unknown function [Pseudomonas marincola]
MGLLRWNPTKNAHLLDVNCAFEPRSALYSLRSRRFSAIFPPQEEQGATELKALEQN